MTGLHCLTPAPVLVGILVLFLVGLWKFGKSKSENQKLELQILTLIGEIRREKAKRLQAEIQNLWIKAEGGSSSIL